jgi:hypothetical protein
MVSRAERALMEGSPSKDAYEESIRSTTAGNVASIREGAMSSTELIGGVTGAYRQELDSMNKLATQEAMYRSGQEQNVQGALGVRGGYEWQIGQQDYSEAIGQRNKAEAAYTEGIQNMWGATNDLGTSIQGNIDQASNFMMMGAGNGAFAGGQNTTPKAAPMQSQFSLDTSGAEWALTNRDSQYNMPYDNNWWNWNANYNR